MRRMQALACAVIASLNNFSAAGEPTFRTWFEAPETVKPGETFQVRLWSSFEREGALVQPGPGRGYFEGIVGSVETSGSGSRGIALTSLIPFPDGLLILNGFEGRVEENWLRDFIAAQSPGFPGVPTIYMNPHPLIMFEVTVGLEAQGDLLVDFRENSADVIRVGWRDIVAGQIVLSDAPGVVFLPETGIIRVIPAPASLALLVPLAIASTRRRRG